MRELCGGLCIAMTTATNASASMVRPALGVGFRFIVTVVRLEEVPSHLAGSRVVRDMDARRGDHHVGHERDNGRGVRRNGTGTILRLVKRCSGNDDLDEQPLGDRRLVPNVRDSLVITTSTGPTSVGTP